MKKQHLVVEEGIVEVGEHTFSCLMEALQEIARRKDACCRRYRAGEIHGRQCPVAIARKALSDARRLSKAFPARRVMTLRNSTSALLKFRS